MHSDAMLDEFTVNEGLPEPTNTSEWIADFDDPFDTITLTRKFPKVTMTMSYDMEAVHNELKDSIDALFPTFPTELHSWAMDISDLLSLCHDAVVSTMLYACKPYHTKLTLNTEHTP